MKRASRKIFNVDNHNKSLDIYSVYVMDCSQFDILKTKMNVLNYHQNFSSVQN